MNRQPWHRILLILAAAALAFGWLAWKCVRDPRINFLPPDSRAEWIFFPAVVDARIHPVATIDTTFRRTFSIEAQPKIGQLEFRAAKRLELRINGETVEIPATRNWKQISVVDISSFLHPGDNKIEARVFNDDAPPALWLELTADSTTTLRTNGSWEASLAGSSWRKCDLVAVPRHPGTGNLLSGGERIFDVLPRVWGMWLVFGALAVLLTVAAAHYFGALEVDHSLKHPLPLLGIFALAWLILFFNNARMLPFHCGYDSNSHLDYIKYIQEHGALPLPNEGFEMFQPPLFYALSAGLLSIFRLSITDSASVTLLRGLSNIFGIATFIFVFLSVRLLFPRERIVQAVGLLIAAFLPMELYLAQYVTNETLTATLVSMAIYFGLRTLTSERAPLWMLCALGLSIGAAMLAKATSLLLVPVLFGAFSLKLARERSSAIEWLRSFAVTTVLILLTSGWFYLRIWRHFGTPVIGNWDRALGFSWWQDPGVHTAGDYFRFGRALIAPLFSGFNGFADGIYSTLWGDSLCGGWSSLLSRTPWNYSLMIGGYWFALIPTLLILIGLACAFYQLAKKPSPEWLLLIGFSGLMAAAFILMTLKVASHAQIKAFYGLPAVVPFCCFAVLGWKIVTGCSRVAQFTVGATLIFFAINSFAAFWIRPSSEQHTYAALRLLARSQPDRALAEATAAVNRSPYSANASYVLAAVLDENDETRDAGDQCRHCLALDPANGDCHLQLAASLEKQGQLNDAMSEAERGLELLPERAGAHNLILALALEFQPDQAIAVGRDALVVSPFDADSHYRVGLAAMQTGDFATAATQFAYALLLDPKKNEHEQKLRVALSFLTSSSLTETIRDLQSFAGDSPRLLEVLASYRQNPNSGP